MSWEAVIGLEVHVQLATASKLFSGAPNSFGAEANRTASAVELGLPGVLPVLNGEVVRMAIRFGLAVQAEIAPVTQFARKNYFYPDLPKGYQISQLDAPIVGRGALTIALPDGQSKVVRITRAHLEEDAGKSLHEDLHGMTGIDLNRAGTPLLEIVSEPDLRSAAEAGAYLREIHALVRCLGISDGNMNEGSLRCDANVSVRPSGTSTLGTRTEIKNVNSFRFLERAIEFEIARQIEVLEGGGQIRQETRLYDADRDETRPMRSKEQAEDYRYFPDPDLLPVEIDDALIEAIRAELPELPAALRARLVAQYGLSEYDARLLAADRDTAEYFETVAATAGDAKLAANWVSGELAGLLNRDALSIREAPVPAPALGALIARIVDGTLSSRTARSVFEVMVSEGGTPDEIIEARGLRQLSDAGELETLVNEIVAAHPAQAEQYRGGKTKLLGFFVGQIMKATGGRANPQQLDALLRERLEKG
ncbi:MAG: Asp-tRNA(Asn)/Glu-tRNA(Gln) amidotransferase subunit GatB [Pseudomonadales bacterium]|jgi:aspartyl-tRNA(Asn)/glutamyl-tRNA(Gln) amidotransferase subunit B|nr:Asp-tRNA(Asn)/Glu-tRNA(Gln) amidotransferase subunit GatB [Pseudomonadales bacterium]